MAKGTYIRLRCTEEFKAQVEALASKQNRTVSNYIENILKGEIGKMDDKKTLEMQYKFGGEWFEIWNTKQTELEDAWNEMDERPEEGGRINFKGSKGFMTVNGGF